MSKVQEISRCESCGPILDPVYKHGGTYWCRACMETEGWPIPNSKLVPLFSTGKDDWQTPPDFFKKYNDKYHFILDAAADSKNHMVDTWFGDGGVEEDTLKANWTPWLRKGNIWLNPPYSKGLQKKFVIKAYSEVELYFEALPAGPKPHHIVCLLPARTDTKLFHEYILPNAKVEFIKGRLKFISNEPLRKGHSNSAPFPSMVVVF